LQEVALDFTQPRGDENGEILLDFSPFVRPKLNPEQKLARDSKVGTLVTAPPGWGKTEVIIQRTENNVQAGIKTLVLVFSRRARKEILRRCPAARTYTFHGYCLGIVGWKNNYPDLLYRFILHEPKEHFDEVIVDECQDLSPLQMDVLRAIPKDSLFAVGDPYQSIYIGDWARSYFDGSALGIKAFDYLAKMCKKELTMTGCRRCTQDILNLLEGIYPRNLKSLYVKPLNQIAVIARSHRKLKECSDFLNANGISHTLYRQRNKNGPEPRKEQFGTTPDKTELLIAHHCKGAQYKAGIIHDWTSFSQEEINLLYTSTARFAENVKFVPVGGIVSHYIPQEYYVHNWMDFLQSIIKEEK